MPSNKRVAGDITLTGHERLGSYGVGMTLPPVSYKRHRFPPQIIAHAVWLYFRFPLSLRLVEEMLLERGYRRLLRNHTTLGDQVRPRLALLP